MSTGAALIATAPPDAEDTSFLGHPKGLGFIVFTEAWERFSFYGMQALLVLYMSSYLLHPGTVESVAGFTAFRAAVEAVFGPLSIQALATQAVRALRRPDLFCSGVRGAPGRPLAGPHPGGADGCGIHGGSTLPDGR
jgi:hypothetical protein